MPSSFTLGRIGGIEIGVHYTWLFAFFLITWSLAQGFFPANFPGFDDVTYWLIAVIAAMLLFASVLVHELSHSFVAVGRGLKVRSITLFIFGGTSNIEGEAQQPKDEFLTSIVGPLTSFGLACVFWLARQTVAPGSTPLGAILGYLAFVNLLLGAFNLVPGFPLDGGRVLRSLLWATTGSLRRATRIASYVGQGFGYLLIFWGVSRLLGGEFLGGLWTAFIGWFLSTAAEATRQQQALAENLRGVRVEQLMDPEPPLAEQDLSVESFVFDHVLRRGRRALLVVDDGRLLGLVSITDAKEVAREDWASTKIGSIMTAVPLKVVSPDADMETALKLLVEGELNQVPVVRDGSAVGMLSRADILRYVQLRNDLELERPAAGPADVRMVAQRSPRARRDAA
jgi:Zn-dependent protease/predicted transcriptional regulator